MKSLSTKINEAFETVNESKATAEALLQKMYDAAKKSKNFKTVEWLSVEKSDTVEMTKAFHIVSKLKGENSNHANDVDTFVVGIDNDSSHNQIVGLYEPNGDVEEFDTVDQFSFYTRCEGVHESVNESKTMEQFLKMIANDYQFDKKSQDYLGLLNINPSDIGEYTDVAKKFVNNIDDYKSLLKKYKLKVQSGADEEECVFVMESQDVNEAKYLYGQINESSDIVNEGVYSKTTKLMPMDVARDKRSKIIAILRSEGDPGFCQLDEENGKGFLTIKASKDNQSEIMDVLNESHDNSAVNEGKKKIKPYANVKVGDTAMENPDAGGEWNNKLGTIAWKGSYAELKKSKYKGLDADWKSEMSASEIADYDLIVIDLDGHDGGPTLFNYDNDPSGTVVFESLGITLRTVGVMESTSKWKLDGVTKRLDKALNADKEKEFISGWNDFVKHQPELLDGLKDYYGCDEPKELFESVNEAKEITTKAQYKEWAETVLKKAHGDKYDQAKADKTIDGILKDVDGDFGSAIGALTSSLGENKEE